MLKAEILHEFEHTLHSYFTSNAFEESRDKRKQ
jgi:oligoendopeptidase F